MKLDLQNGILKIKLEGWERFFAMKRELDISHGDIVSAHVGEAEGMVTDFRLPGSYMPGFIKAGSFWSKSRGWEFWYVRRGYFYSALTIQLKNESKYRRVVLGMEEASQWANMFPEKKYHGF